MGAESVVSEAEVFASDLCYAGLAVSLPGYGATEVPPRIDPNITLKVVLDGVSLVKQLPWVDSKRLYLYGFSRGAFFAALLASRLDGIEGVILHSGAYDLNRFYQDTIWFRSMLNPDGVKNPKLISILPEVPTWHAPTLVLHGEEDFLVSVEQANLLSESLEAAKKPYRLVLYPHSGHYLPSEGTSEERSPPFSKKSPDQPAVLAPVDLFDKLIRRSKFTALHSSKNSHRAVRLFIVIGQR